MTEYEHDKTYSSIVLTTIVSSHIRLDGEPRSQCSTLELTWRMRADVIPRTHTRRRTVPMPLEVVRDDIAWHGTVQVSLHRVRCMSRLPKASTTVNKPHMANPR